MSNNVQVIFSNKSKISDFNFWQELGLSDNFRILRLRTGQSIVQNVFPDNAWAAFEKVVYQDVTAADGEIRQVIKCTPRKKYDQEIQNGGVFLDINLNVSNDTGRKTGKKIKD